MCTWCCLNLHDEDRRLIFLKTEISMVCSESQMVKCLLALRECMQRSAKSDSIIIMIIMEQNSEADIRFLCFVIIHTEAWRKQLCYRHALTNHINLKYSQGIKSRVWKPSNAELAHQLVYNLLEDKQSEPAGACVFI